MTTTINLIKAESNLLNLTSDEVITPHIQSAELECKRILGNERYNSIVSSVPSLNIEYQLLQKSEPNFAIAFFLYSLNLKSEGYGILTKNSQLDEIKELMNQSDLEKLHQHYKTIAEKFIEIILDQSNIKYTNSDQLEFLSLGGS